MAPTEEITIIVKAEDAENQKYSIEATIEATQPLREVAKHWASQFQLPEGVVGLEGENGAPVNLNKTPAEMGCSSGHVLWAVPLAESHSERHDVSEAGNREDAATETQVAEPPAKRTCLQSKDGVTSAAGPATPQKQRAATPPSAASTAAASSGSASSSAGSSAQASVASVLKKATPKAASTPKSAAAPKAAVAAPKPDSGECPSGDDKIQFAQPNPKRSGGLSWNRYEKYMRGKTINEAMQMGASKGDIAHDFKQGYLTRRR